MKKVTFKPMNPKNGTQPIIEFTDADVDAIRLRAMALNWFVVSIEE